MELTRDGALAILEMRAGKANAMGPTMLQQLSARIDDVQASDARALVITGDGRSFSAGLALPELIELDRPAMTAFIDTFGTVMARVFMLSLPVVAAIDGHAIAGGYVLACQCDVRIAADAGQRIGLNEVQLGIGLPAVVLESLRTFLPPAAFVEVALEGALVDPTRAHALGMVDQVVAPATLREAACARARMLADVPAAAFAQVKRGWRAAAHDAIARTDAALREAWIDTWFSTEAQQRLRAAVQRIRSRA